MNRPIFGLVGAAGAGKDSVADHLGANYCVDKYGFARPLKQLCARLFKWDEARLDQLDYKEAVSAHEPLDLSNQAILEVLEDQEVAPTTLHVQHVTSQLRQCGPSLTRREILQRVGTECFRAINEHHWIERALAHVDNMLKSPLSRGVALTDVRFPNEAEVLRERYPDQAIVVKVVRLGDTATEHSGHESEQLIDQIPVDFTVEAAFGELPKLYQQVDRVCRSFGLEEVA